MLLVEIFEPKSTKEKIPKSKHPLGSGAVATVYSHETDPHMVVKKEKSHSNTRELGRYGIHSRHDAFAYYVDAAGPYMSSNPYLPRVYVKNKRQAKNGIISYTYVVERLFERYDPNFNNPIIINSIVEKALADPYMVLMTKLPSAKWSAMCEVITHAIEYNKWDTFKDPNLIEAGKIIHQAMSKYKEDWPQDDARIRIDLHAGNYMLRPTPHGVQLVITDPLYSH